MEKTGKILIIDDNEDVLFALNILLSPHVEKIKVSTHPEKIEQFMGTFHPDVILLDMNFRSDVSSGHEGFQWLEKIRQIDPQAVVILMTAYADTDKAVRAIKAGATDFISKPWQKEKLLATLFAALKLHDTQQEVDTLRKRVEALDTSETDSEIIGESEAISKVFTMIEKIAGTDANVLIIGENGTGKDLAAQSIYRQSPRADHVFARIDLGSIPDTLFESELFGYEKGAFTDARKERHGRMETASGGTLFLDEIANLSMQMQSKLLTAIEKKQIVRLGSNKVIPIDVRFICATNADIYSDVENGHFRQDLLYRINTIEIYLPPLRERGNDTLLLADYFLQRFARKYKKEITGISREAQNKLMAYKWPGNIRELQHTVERGVILASDKKLSADDITLQAPNTKRKTIEDLDLITLEKIAIEKALERSNGNMNKAADLLGITRFALYRKLKQ